MPVRAPSRATGAAERTVGPVAGARAVQQREEGGRDTGRRSRRVLVLLALAVVFALVLAPPLRLYLQQQRDVSELRSEIGTREADVAALRTEVGLWQEDPYVAAQARDRLNFVMPGETGFVVPDPEPSPDAAASDPTSAAGLEAARPDALPEGTWYDRLWSSVEAVGTGTFDPVLDAPVVGGPGG